MKLFELNLDVQGTGQAVASPDHNTGPGGRSWGWKIWLGKARKMPWKAEDDFGQFRGFRVSIILPSYLVLLCACYSFCPHPLNTVRFASAPASRSALPPGDYYFAWARDGALSMNAYLQTKPFPQSDEKMEKWIQSLEKAQHESDPNGINVPWPMRRMWDGQKELAGWVSFRDLFVAQSFQRM